MVEFLETKEICYQILFGGDVVEKVYEVEFMQYTNYRNDTISDNNEDIGKIKYLNVGIYPQIIKESDLQKYVKYGNGFRSIKFIGNILE